MQGPASRPTLSSYLKIRNFKKRKKKSGVLSSPSLMRRRAISFTNLTDTLDKLHYILIHDTTKDNKQVLTIKHEISR